MNLFNNPLRPASGGTGAQLVCAFAFLLVVSVRNHSAVAQQRTAPTRATWTAQATPATQPAATPTPTPAPAATQPPAEQPAAQTQPAADLSPHEIARLKTAYAALTDGEKAEMVAVYHDLGIDLLAVLGLKAAEAKAGPPKSLPDALRTLDFARKPEAVLAARSQLGFAASYMPDIKNTEPLAKWLHMNVMAGEWHVLAQVLPLLAADDATAVYSHILRSTNEGAQSLLPEEVLALGDACPGEMADWQLDVLSQLLKNAAGGYGKGQLLAQIKTGTRRFGAQDDARRQRTVRLLVGAGLALEAHEYLPSLDDARRRGDARIIYAHGRYYLDLVTSGRTGEQEGAHLAKAWDLLGEVSLMSSADATLRKEAMKHGIDLLTRIPPAQATEWLIQVFASEALGPAALEVVALHAVSFRDKKIDAAQKAAGLATMKAAVDTLLRQEQLDLQMLRVPLRMLTTALADEVDAVVKEKGEIRGVAREAELLFRASPDERWLGAIEASVAIRGYRAAIAIATICDEHDIGLDVLANAVKRFPQRGADFADEFLVLWQKRLNPRNRPEEENMFFYWGPQRMPAAPLTRGRQRRNLIRLERVIAILDEMGIDGRQLPSVTAAFKGCHARTEVFERELIAGVFGPLDQLSAATCAALAESMRVGLGGDWRSRQVQRTYGMMRSRAEISELVEVGYELAIELAGRAVALEPDSWQHAVLKAALSYDRVQFKQNQQNEDFATFNEYRRQAFATFEQASMQYADLVTKGLERDSSGVYLRWFSAVLDVGNATPSTQPAEAAETAASEDQIRRIRKSMEALPPDAFDRHVGAFARDVVEALGQAPPERKPTIVRAAVQIVADHPAGAPLRRLGELYEDLLKNEIRLRVTVDGSDRVSSGRLFAAVLTLRYTNSVDRETGGFDKYLYQDAYVRIGNQFRQINYQGQIRKSIETALADSFDVDSIGFFEPLTPSRAVKEEGQLDWQEKPMAYILMEAKDPSVDRIPQISFDMHFDDPSGPVTLPIVSDSPPIDAAGAPVARPVKNLTIEQTVDVRRLVAGTDDRAVTLEVHAKGDGVIPELRDLLDGLDGALPGYEIASDGIEARPINTVQTDDGRSQRFMPWNLPSEEKTYIEADENGIFRLPTERSWLVTFKPTGAAVGSAFTLPVVKPGVEAALVSREYADMDIAEVQTAAVSIIPRWSTGSKLAIAAGAVVLAALAVWRLLRRRKPLPTAEATFTLPTRITPLSTIAALERIGQHAAALDAGQRDRLVTDIAAVQRAHFGPNGSPAPDEAAMRDMLERWATVLRR